MKGSSKRGSHSELAKRQRYPSFLFILFHSTDSFDSCFRAFRSFPCVPCNSPSHSIISRFAGFVFLIQCQHLARQIDGVASAGWCGAFGHGDCRDPENRFALV